MKSRIIILLAVFPFMLTAQTGGNNTEIEKTISAWHQAAANANFETYTSLMTEGAIFIGTDPTEYWEGKAFRDFAKPYFDRGKAWTFYTLDRNIFVDSKYKVSWFDELLDTQMGICRGSGVLVYTDGQWKINHYVLSITIPNDNVVAIKEMNDEFYTSFKNTLKE